MMSVLDHEMLREMLQLGWTWFLYDWRQVRWDFEVDC
jgi:hypothetical protein